MISGTLQQDPIEPIVNRFRKALIDCCLETGYAHFEIDCELINKEKGIIQVVLTLGIKYSSTISREEVRANTQARLIEEHTAESAGPLSEVH